MKSTIQAVLFSAFACVFLFSSVTAFADGEECLKDPPNAKAALKRAKEAESAKPVQALLLYGKIWFCVDKNGPGEVEAGKKRILENLARAQEKKGFIHSNGNYLNYVVDAHCAKLDKARMEERGDYSEYDEMKGPDNECVNANRAEFNRSSGAFEILWGAGERAEADAALMRGVKAKPKDLEIVRFAFEHFTPGEGNNSSDGYIPDPGSGRELRRIATQNTDDLLAKEDKSFGDKTISLSVTDELAGMSPAKRSLKLLGEAKEWALLVDRQTADKVLARAKKRGADVLEIDKKSPSHVSLSEALELYEFAGDDGVVRDIKATADRRGEQSAFRGEAREAVFYFGISGNKKRASELSGETKKGYDKKNPEKDVLKGDKEKKQFKKGTDDLEKELGM